MSQVISKVDELTIKIATDIMFKLMDEKKEEITNSDLEETAKKLSSIFRELVYEISCAIDNLIRREHE